MHVFKRVTSHQQHQNQIEIFRKGDKSYLNANLLLTFFAFCSGWKEKSKNSSYEVDIYNYILLIIFETANIDSGEYVQLT